MLIARGMELSVADPTFLDMRNAIIQADKVAFGSNNTDQAVEGLRQPRHGLVRRRLDGADAFPAEDFHAGRRRRR